MERNLFLAIALSVLVYAVRNAHLNPRVLVRLEVRWDGRFYPQYEAGQEV